MFLTILSGKEAEENTMVVLGENILSSAVVMTLQAPEDQVSVQHTVPNVNFQKMKTIPL